MSVSDPPVPWHAGLEPARRLADQLIAQESGVHAILLYGAEGAGKSLVAEHLAAAWLSADHTEGHVDFLPVAPLGAGNQIRLAAIKPSAQPDREEGLAVRQFLRVPPLKAPHKVVWIRHAHRMNLDAGNALLKMLEEPPAYAKFILTTHLLSQVLATLRSRCLNVACGLPDSLDNMGADPTLTAQFAAHSPGRAAAIAAYPEFYAEVAEILDQATTRGPMMALAVSERLKKLSAEYRDRAEVSAREGSLHVLETCMVGLRSRGVSGPILEEGLRIMRWVAGNVSAGAAMDRFAIDLCQALSPSR